MIKRALCLIFAFLTLVPSFAQASGKSGAHTFTDVAVSSPFYDAISWAVTFPSEEEAITRGTTKTTFSPQSTCTRAQIITFIWRYQGSPAVKTNPYDDTVGGYYETAAAWAFYNDYESGDAAAGGRRLFNGQTPCTRATAVTYLWRLSGRPTVSLNKARVFQDMSAYASEESLSVLQAVAWAVQNGITNGTSPTTFRPEATCTRGQIVTFLYRYNANVANG